MCRSGRRSRGKRGCWRLAAMVPSSGYCGRQRPVLQELQRKISLWTPLKLGTPPIGDTSSPTSLPVLCIVPLPEFCDSEHEEGRRGGASGVADGEFSGFTLLRLGRETTPAPTVPSPAGRLSAVGRLPKVPTSPDSTDEAGHRQLSSVPRPISIRKVSRSFGVRY